MRISRDGEAMVFHDELLDRLTPRTGPVAALSANALRRVELAGMAETIPTLKEVLDLIRGRAPLLIELKASRGKAALVSKAVADALRDYEGDAAIMSFNPEVGAWFARNDPQVLRGLIVSEHGRRGLRGRAERALSLRRSRAEFLACDIADLPSSFASAARASGLPVLTWTVRTEVQKSLAALHADQIIHELPS